MKTNEKKDRLLESLDKGMTMIHLDARSPGVSVPEQFKSQAHLLLNLSYRFVPPDLSVNDWGIRSTLDFAGHAFTVAIPWSALFAITSHVTKEFWIFPEDMPAEILAQAHEAEKASQEAPRSTQEKAALRQVTSEEPAVPASSSSPPRRGHLRLVK